MSTYTFENELLPTTMVQQRKHAFVVRHITLFSGLMNMLTFDTLQIPSGCIQIRSGCNAPTTNLDAPACIPLATDLAEGMAFV